MARLTVTQGRILRGLLAGRLLAAPFEEDNVYWYNGTTCEELATRRTTIVNLQLGDWIERIRGDTPYPGADVYRITDVGRDQLGAHRQKVHIGWHNP